jgi:hypothetical protein
MPGADIALISAWTWWQAAKVARNQQPHLASRLSDVFSNTTQRVVGLVRRAGRPQPRTKKHRTASSASEAPREGRFGRLTGAPPIRPSLARPPLKKTFIKLILTATDLNSYFAVVRLSQMLNGPYAAQLLSQRVCENWSLAGPEAACWMAIKFGTMCLMKLRVVTPVKVLYWHTHSGLVLGIVTYGALELCLLAHQTDSSMPKSTTRGAAAFQWKIFILAESETKSQMLLMNMEC